MATIWYMWPTRDGKGWIVATRIEGDMNAALSEGGAIGLPKAVLLVECRLDGREARTGASEGPVG